MHPASALHAWVASKHAVPGGVVQSKQTSHVSGSEAHGLTSPVELEDASPVDVDPTPPLDVSAPVLAGSATVVEPSEDPVDPATVVDEPTMVVVPGAPVEPATPVDVPSTGTH
jgi:hypothetical protein